MDVIKNNLLCSLLIQAGNIIWNDILLCSNRLSVIFLKNNKYNENLSLL